MLKKFFINLFVSIILVSCSSDDDAPVTDISNPEVENEVLSKENKISSFKLVIDNETFEGEINEKAKTIIFNLPKENISSLVPSIEYSEKAVIIPEQNLAQDFNKIVYYTVEAENGDRVKYKVITNSPKIENVRAKYTGSRMFYTNGVLLISGKFINPNRVNAKLYLFDGNNKYPLPILFNESYERESSIVYYIEVKIPEGIPTYDKYKIIYESNEFNSQSENTIDVVSDNPPIITSLDKTIYGVDDFITIRGFNLTDKLAVPYNGNIYIVHDCCNYLYSYQINLERTEIKFKTIRQIYGWSNNPRKVTITLLGSGGRVGATILTEFGVR